MQLDQEINRIFARLNDGLVSLDVAVSAIEQLISTHVRKPMSQLDASIRSTIDEMRSRGADFEAIQAQIEAWIHIRANTDDRLIVWL